jgi:hypothetical protein
VSRVPLREIRAALRRETSADRLVSLELIVEEPDGRELVRAGGVWDSGLHCYVRRPPDFVHMPERVRLQVSQVAPMRGLAAWLEKMRRGDRNRPVVFMLGGKPGSGKTFLLMIFHALVALEWPGDVQFTSNLNTDNRGECLKALQAIAQSHWYIERDDPKNPRLAFANGAELKWASARNPKKLRQRGLPIRAVGINEGQDQSEELYAIAQSGPRGYGGAAVITMNPPTVLGGNWTTRLWFGIEAGDVRGEIYEMDSADNAAVDHDFIDASGQAIRIAAPRLAAAEVDGIMASAGPSAYPSFNGRPFNHASPLEGGCVGLPPDLGWVDATRELTANDMGSPRGADVVIGCDFQKHPGCVGDVGRIYRRLDGRLVLFIECVVGVPGLEDAFSQALIDAGYTANGWREDGTPGPIALLIGDGTSDRQNAEHNARKGPPSFHAMRNNGWVIKGPMLHHKHRIPWNPSVPESLDQMFTVFERREILLGPRCREPSPGFPSLVDSLRNAQKNSFGKLRRGEVFQHACDGVRYLAWKYLPRHKPAPGSQQLDTAKFAALAAIKIGG